ncbi:MAG: acetyltransferase, partial [Gammaproteobacteria bacterium]|nr:acetyltransferase [Gammaproteobacteria bacterium]
NGDADGICALHQLRLAKPMQNTLITGVKRDISLLERVEAKSGDQVTVLDISLDKNRAALDKILQQGAEVLYFDHHFAGDIPRHQGLQAHIDTSATVCTSLLVDRYLNGQFRAWAVTAAFGDNLHDSAKQTAQELQLNNDQLGSLNNLGTYLNYNGYGSALEDLHFHPADLYQKVQPYEDPLRFIAEDSAFQELQDGYNHDMENTKRLQAEVETEKNAVFILPNAPWARRVSGVFGNELARRFPDRAHALLTLKKDGGYVVSVRAPIATKTGADALCRQFETGGGRQAAAGVNHLPENNAEKFIEKFQQAFS